VFLYTVALISCPKIARKEIKGFNKFKKDKSINIKERQIFLI
jgi:hypothetical protein